MHVDTKKIAVSGMLAAFSAVLMYASTMLETSTLFLISLASFSVGIVIREWGNRTGVAFWIASTLIHFLIVPNKFYCGTYLAMGLYILLSEVLWEKIAESGYLTYRRSLLWLGKFIIFDIMFVPAVLFLQGLIFQREISTMEMLIVVAVGQVALIVYDNAYRYFQGAIWGRIRIKLMG